ncbi:MAG: tetratricopeptide repeat protein [Bacteroidota bacterium]
MIPRRYAIVFFFFLLAVCPDRLSAQQNNPLINSGELLQKGNKLHGEKKYKEAIDLYSQISRSDTNYTDALYELAYSCYSDGQHERGHQYALDGMKLFPDDFTRFALMDGNILDEMDRAKDALLLYGDALSRNPHSAILYFNRGLAFIKDKQLAEARKDFEQCLLINPYYSSAHYYLGTMYYDAGNIVAAMLAFKTYLFVSPGGKYTNTIIQKLSNIAKVTDEVLENVKKYKPGKEDNFDLQQQILLSKIALDKGYKLKAELEDQIVRQIQVVDEKLEYIRNDKGFCMQYYVPLYIKIFKDELFEPMVFMAFSGLDLKNIQAWNKKNKKEIEKFSEVAVDYFNEIRNTRVLTATERKDAPVWYLFEQGKFTGKGGYKRKDDKKLFFGNWEFFYESGRTSAKGMYNEAEKKSGEWLYYYKNGQLKQKLNYKDDVEEGLTEAWYSNGNKWYAENYVAGNVEGGAETYYYNGFLKNKIEYRAGEKNGVQKNYNSTGELYSTQSYKGDKINGEIITYYTDGKVKDRLNYVDDKAVGVYKSYHRNGAINQQGEFVDGMRQGLWTANYEDGAVKDKTTYANDEITGEFTEYHENGKLSSKGNYTRKKIDGLVESYDDDGIKYTDALYEKGRLKEINFYDKKGNNISSNTTRRGAANITFFSPEGIKTSEGFFDKEGLKQGKYTQYFASGKISSEVNYKDGQEDGPAVDYYNNGKKKLEHTFSNGEEDGYVKGYFYNGKLSYEGWVIKGSQQQHIIYYNYFGDIIEKVFYLDNEPDGYTDFIYPGNTRYYEYKYENGWLETITQFDTSGKVISSNVFEKGTGPLIYKHDNGKISGSGNYKNYMLAGPYTSYFFDGSTRFTSYYTKNERDSFFKEYFYGGGIKSEGKFKDGNKTGVWKVYYENGKIKDEANYKEGNMEGLDRSFNADGTFDKVINYKNNQLEGDFKIYGDNNQLALVFYYKGNVLQSYSYEDKTGKLVTPVQMKGASGKVVAYYKNGTKSAEINFLDNDVQGVRKFFYSNGKPYIDGIREFGYDNGEKKVYFPSGTLMKDENYVLGNFHGLRKTFYANEKIESEENYYNDELHGTCKYYDIQGKLKQTRKYFHGNLLSAQ